MDFDADPAKYQQIDPPDPAFSNAGSPIFHHHYQYNPGVAIPGFFVPFPSPTMYPNAAIEQLATGKIKASFQNRPRQDRTGHGSLGTASSQFQQQQLSANPETDFISTPQFETRDLFAIPGQQDRLDGAANHYPVPNNLEHQQAGTFAHASPDIHSYCPTYEQQDWYNDPAAPTSMPAGFHNTRQDSTAHNPFTTGFDQVTSTHLPQSNGTSENTNFSGNRSYDTHLNVVSPNTGTCLTGGHFETLASYSASSPLQESFARAAIPGPEASTSTDSPTPSPTNVTSPDSTRHQCAYCLSTVARQGDLRRHEMIHFPERHRKYHCWELGCDRNGQKGFTRRDKWRDHVRGVHGLEEDEVAF